ncbi:MAG: hypothetical protein FJZ01_06665 [Candidatus Sericytochromatia bacterium]|nr:hypothetical protein [Candidatus Tanganyikabacteria bacterium]
MMNVRPVAAPGEVGGLPARAVQAVALPIKKNHSTAMEAGLRLSFERLDAWYYLQAQVGVDRKLVMMKVLIVEPAKPSDVKPPD